MSNELWGRKIEVIIRNKVLTYPELYIEFETNFDTEPIPDLGEVNIYNLSDNTLAEITLGDGIIVNAGYNDDIGSIFHGVISEIETTNEGVDTVTKIKMINVTQQYLNRYINFAYGAGANTKYLIRDMLDYAGGLKPNINNPTNNITYPRGFQATGKIKDVLTRVVEESGSRWLIHGSSISVIPKETGYTQGVYLDAKSGLMSVEKLEKQDGVSTHKIEMMLNHAIAPYSLLEVHAKNLDGVVMVVKGKHKSDFTTELEVRTL